MSWEDRLLEASYISPSGIPFNFLYEDVSYEFDKKTTSFIFPDIDGAYVQDMGVGENRYPLNIIFCGENYDLEADRFIKALKEKGRGTLIHPKYGIKKVVPFGTIKRNDGIVNNANQCIFEIIFIEDNIRTDNSLLGSISNIIDKIQNCVDVYAQYASFNFVKTFAVTSVGELITIRDIATQSFTDVFNQISYIAGINDDYDSILKLLNDSFIDTINEIGNKPINAINMLMSAMLIPAQIPNYDVSSKLDIFENLINPKLKTKYNKSIYDANIANTNFAIDKVFMYTAAAGMCQSVIYSEIKTRDKALEINDRINNNYNNIQRWLDDNIKSLSFTDDESDYNNILELISQTKNYLVNNAFNLSSANKIILDEDRNIFELVSELYGSLENIDDFISLNKLNIQEIEILPKGKEIVYYL
ncbi:DNA circularization N-terminal domain-containing protein [uncultured Brachyspira sp.]|uniref:DNA circularization N-terminal domain-containing protein n=1 Tax=uncultured Brachyspira sp. TaxID=221953 RepID=UPI0026272470|nr:DNA circularization N-terminal domain-containing protein [uncultured Brachyspira sp.]